MPGLDFQRLRSEISMCEVLDLLQFVAVNGSGEQLYGPCPLHAMERERSRCFSVNLKKARFYCHQCRQHGNQLELWAAATKQSLYDAALELCERLSREPPWIHRW